MKQDWRKPFPRYPKKPVDKVPVDRQRFRRPYHRDRKPWRELVPAEFLE